MNSSWTCFESHDAVHAVYIAVWTFPTDNTGNTSSVFTVDRLVTVNSGRLTGKLVMESSVQGSHNSHQSILEAERMKLQYLLPDDVK